MVQNDRMYQTTIESESLPPTVIAAIADHKGVDPLDLDPLYAVVDSDTLERLLSWSVDGDKASIGDLVFTYHDVEVRVTGEGDVHVTDSAGRSPATVADTAPSK